MSKAEINVNGKIYSMACAPGQEARLVALGKRLDARVREIAKAVGDIGEARLFLIASLALMDEVDALRKLPEQERMDDRASMALADAAARIDALASRLVSTHQTD